MSNHPLQHLEELVFVYNAKAGKLHAALDFAHKALSPSTYACDLCKLTHHNFGQRKEWDEFVKNTGIKMTFYHIEDFEKAYNQSFEYPIVLKKNSGNDMFDIVLGKAEISVFKDVNELIKHIQVHIS